MNAYVTGAAVVLLMLTALTLPVAGQSGGLSIDAPAVQTEPGGEVNVTFEATNGADSASAAIINITNRPGWSVAGRQDAGGLWQAKGKWLFQTMTPGETTRPALVLSVPDGATGEFTVAATITDGERTDRTETTIRVVQSSTQAAAQSGGDTLVGLLRANSTAVAGLAAVVLVLFVIAFKL